jgi:prepilin-type N-terminal cleavage/methylation domain-containing protein
VIAHIVAARRRRGAKGFTLIELSISMLLFGVLSSLFVGVIIVATRSLRQTQQFSDINEDARLMLNRMSLEIRTAQDIEAVTNPYDPSAPTGHGYTPGGDTSLEVWDDVNDNGVRDTSGPDLELVTYKYVAADKQVYIEGDAATQPVLAGDVTSFTFSFNSRLYHDTKDLSSLDGDDGSTKDGTLSWWELDQDPTHTYGNGNGVLDAAELQYIDSVTVRFTINVDGHSQKYQTTIDLRNRA